MPGNLETVLSDINAAPRKWLVTGAAGFIGSNLVETLLRNKQTVVALDNFSTGYQDNVNKLRSFFDEKTLANFSFTEGDIRDFETCIKLTDSVDIVLHQAALGSVPRSVKEPLNSHASNVDGFINMLKASVDNGVDRFVYASSSSVYGDHPELPKEEAKIGKPLSPYAATKLIDEVYADVFAKTYQISTVGLRYFNVFGRRQSPDGPYAAVIPRWAKAVLSEEQIEIYGDGETSRDFCYIDNVVQANILAGLKSNLEGAKVYNVACGQRTSLTDLYKLIKEEIKKRKPDLKVADPEYKDFRVGDVKHSLADISLIKAELGYQPNYLVDQGLSHAMDWYIENL